jgi:hypothetical protein
MTAACSLDRALSAASFAAVSACTPAGCTGRHGRHRPVSFPQ